MNPIKQLFGQTAVYGFGTVVPRLLNYLLLTPFFTRVFDLGEYGVVTELYAYVVFLIIILTYGMETGFFRYAQLHKDGNEVFSTSVLSLFATSAGFIILTTIFSDNIAGIVGYGDQPEFILWIGIIVGIDAFTAIPFARLRWENKAAKFAAIRIASVVVNITLNFAFLYLIPEKAAKGPLPEWLDAVYDPGIGVGYVFISNIASSAVTLLMLSGTIFKLKLKFNGELWRKMLVYSLPLLIAGMAGTINEALDRVLLRHLLPDTDTALAQLGIYGANYKIAVLMTLFIQMFRYASEPFYFGQAERENARFLFAEVMKYFIIVALGIFLLVTLYLDMFKHFIGSAFHEGLHIVPVVLLANILLGIFFNLSIWYKLNNLTRYGAMITIMGAVITFSVNWFLIPVYGYIASAWAHVACYGTMVCVSWMLGRKYFRIQYPYKSIGIYVLIALGVYVGAAYTANMESVTRLLINTGLLVVFSIIVVLKEYRNIKNLSG
ncbi:MAG TPA: polysaccharide biosynthesis protein [Bacteroides sp.]|nr:polysaccharide biosynthesis protein [Bacteroides sp.]